MQRKGKVNQVNHSDLVVGKMEVNQVKTKLQAGQARSDRASLTILCSEAMQTHYKVGCL